MRVRVVGVWLATFALLLLPGVAVASTPGPYAAWTSPVGVPSGAPHAGYMTSPERCGVCHMAEAASGYVPREGSNDGCVFCHVSTTLGGLAVYGGSPSRYTDADSFGHNGPGVSCIGCHAVHGGILQNPDGVTRKILKAGTYQREAIAAFDPETAPHDIAVSVWCTQCHACWRQADGPADPRLVHEHPLGVATADFDRAGTSYAGRVSFKDAVTCRSCHAAGVTDGGPGVVESSYPHHTPGAVKFLVAAETASSAEATSVDSDTADGVCLRCHRDRRQGAMAGVGFTY